MKSTNDKGNRARQVAAEKSPAYQWYPRDILSDAVVAAMSNEVEGIYRRLLDHAWLENGLPADLDRIRPLCRVESRRKFEQIWMQLSPLFPQGPDGRRRNPRQERERKKQRKHSKVRQLAARARWGHLHRRRNANASANALQTACSALAFATADQDQDQEQRALPRRARPARMTVDPDDRRAHLLAAVHKLIDIGPPYVDASGNPVISEITAELKSVAVRLDVGWRHTRQLDRFINAAIAARASGQ